MIERLIRDNPQFHGYKDVPTSWWVHPDTLRFLYQMLEPVTVTLETGCGQTTIAFPSRKTRHPCITPNKEGVVCSVPIAGI